MNIDEQPADNMTGVRRVLAIQGWTSSGVMPLFAMSVKAPSRSSSIKRQKNRILDHFVFRSVLPDRFQVQISSPFRPTHAPSLSLVSHHLRPPHHLPIDSSSSAIMDFQFVLLVRSRLQPSNIFGLQLGGWGIRNRFKRRDTR